MSPPRVIGSQERAVLSALLQLEPQATQFIEDLNDLLVQQRDDGGMGSLLLIPKGTATADRRFGKQIARGEFTDSDGMLVSVTINVDRDNTLYEQDLWKVDFSPLLRWPRPEEIRRTEF